MFHSTIVKGFIIAIAFGISMTSFSQTSLQREYLYDEGGNRICRKVLEIPANTLRNLRQQTEETPASYFVLHPKSWTLNFVYIVFTDKIYPVLDRIHS